MLANFLRHSFMHVTENRICLSDIVDDLCKSFSLSLVQGFKRCILIHYNTPSLFQIGTSNTICWVPFLQIIPLSLSPDNLKPFFMICVMEISVNSLFLLYCTQENRTVPFGSPYLFLIAHFKLNILETFILLPLVSVVLYACCASMILSTPQKLPDQCVVLPESAIPIKSRRSSFLLSRKLISALARISSCASDSHC